MQNFRLPFNIRMVLPLWLPINTTQLEFSLSPNTLSQVCFAVELTGCLSSNGKCIATYIFMILVSICMYLGLSQICWHNLKHNRLTCYASIMLAFWGSILE